MDWLKMPDADSDMRDLMRSAGQKLIYTVGGLYLLGHVIATLAFPWMFVPGIWGVSIYMLALVVASLLLIQHRFFLSQLIWLIGLAGAIVLVFFVFKQPEVLFLLVLVPLMAVVTLGIPGAVITVLFVLVVTDVLILTVEGIPSSYAGVVLFGGSAFAAFGWSLSSNLLEAVEAASYHYSEARRLLAESQAHQVEIARILKDRNQVNYQLERMNDMLKFSRVQAEEASENRNRFMLAVSHELRSPLNFIIGFSDLMVNAPETYAPASGWPSGLYDDVQEIYTSSKHLMRLINDILDMGKIDAGQMSLYREKAHIDQILADVRQMLSGAFEQKGITLTMELPPDLPPVFIDTTRIRQVFLNLLNNGLRFTDRGGVTLRVGKMDTHLLVSVIDTGMGIAPADLSKVFEEFRQVGEENWRRHTGTGLGLYISRHFVELHGGEMGVESSIGRGTRFYFTLPYEAPVIETSLAFRELRTPGGDPRILLVTPNPQDAEILQRSLDGYVLQQVSNAEQAREKTRELFPHAILVAADADAPASFNLPYDLPVVTFQISRSVSPMQNLRARLVKPVSRQALLKAIHSLGGQVHRLLVLDDDPAMVRFIEQSFRADGNTDPSNAYSLLSAFSGAEGMQILQKNAVDAILLDLELPDVRGWDWLLHLQECQEFAQIPVIIVSAQDLPQDDFIPGTNALELALHRPLMMHELGSVIKSILENVLPQYPREKQ
jgi:signal transduction histidine kinase/CheY-like chemotaxis protein